MFTYLNTLHGTADLVFLICAVAGASLFALRCLLMFVGDIFGASDTLDEAYDDGHHGHLEPSFKLLTMHTMTGFLMIFGLLGLGLRYQLDYPLGLALAMAILAGFFMMLLVAVIFYGASFLTSVGNVFKIENTVGLAAVVYLQISPDADGKVQLLVGGVTRELGARAAHGEIIESFAHVKIIGVIDQQTVLVQK